MRNHRHSSGLLSTALLLFAVLIGGGSHPVAAAVSTPEDRAALLEHIISLTLAREAFSDIKNRRLGIDIEREMRAYKDEIMAADNDTKLFYTLVKISNLRRDRHLRVAAAAGGLKVPPGYALGANSNYPDMDRPIDHPVWLAPIKFHTDYTDYSFFVSDFGRDIARYPGGESLRVGDRLTAVNGVPIDDYVAAIRPYHRHSTENGFWARTAIILNERSPIMPADFYGEAFTVDLHNGEKSYRLTLPYLHQKDIHWRGYSERRYPDFEKLFETPSYHLYRHSDKPVLLIAWIRGKYYGQTIPRLLDYAKKHNYLNYDLIFDGTIARGGSGGAYVIQRLSPKPFQTMFGNLRLSDAAMAFAGDVQARLAGRPLRGGSGERVDDGGWLLDWVTTDLLPAFKTGQRYSNSVPFKTAHAPRYSDGVIYPATTHFRGRMVCLFGPYGGSHLDQMAAILIENRLCTSLGMSTGGYSNTWEHEAVLRFPISGKPVVKYMWNMGHTIRTNGQVLEGNPVAVDEYLPVTRDNFTRYYDLLLKRALDILDSHSTP